MTRPIKDIERDISLHEASCAIYKQRGNMRALSSCAQSLDARRMELAKAKAELESAQ